MAKTKQTIAEIESPLSNDLPEGRYDEIVAKLCSDSGVDLKDINPESLNKLFQDRREELAPLYDLSSPLYFHNVNERASFIVHQIGIRRAIEKDSGRDFAIVMNVTPDEINSGGGARVKGFLVPAWLRGAAKITFDFCGEHGLKPTLEYWDTQDGRYCAHNIVIHFDKSASLPTTNLTETVLDKLPVRALLEASCGRDHAVIMSFRGNEAQESAGVLDPSELKGAEKNVYDHCVQKGWNPSIEYWDSVTKDSTTSGFNIVVNW